MRLYLENAFICNLHTKVTVTYAFTLHVFTTGDALWNGAREQYSHLYLNQRGNFTKNVLDSKLQSCKALIPHKDRHIRWSSTRLRPS